MQRIAAIVRQLLDAGRLAASPETRASVPLRPLVDDAFSAARARFGKRVRLTNLVAPESVHVLGQRGRPRAGAGEPRRRTRSRPSRTTARTGTSRSAPRGAATASGSWWRTTAAGMEPDVLRRVFEPFFTTKPFGSGSGLGLAGLRGLVTEPRTATCASRASPASGDARDRRARRRDAARRTRSTGPAREAGRAARCACSSSTTRPPCSRRCAGCSSRGTGSSSRPAWTRGSRARPERPFDLVLCDVMMPAGGGERLYRTLLGRAPALARRVVFFTGGAVTDAARQFLGEPAAARPVQAARCRAVSRASPSGCATARDARLARPRSADLRPALVAARGGGLLRLVMAGGYAVRASAAPVQPCPAHASESDWECQTPVRSVAPAPIRGPAPPPRRRGGRMDLFEKCSHLHPVVEADETPGSTPTTACSSPRPTPRWSSTAAG